MADGAASKRGPGRPGKLKRSNWREEAWELLSNEPSSAHVVRFGAVCLKIGSSKSGHVEAVLNWLGAAAGTEWGWRAANDLRSASKGSPLRHPSWLSCGQWPARTGCSSTRPRLPGCRSKLRRRRSPPGWRLSSGPVSPDDAAAARSGAPDVLVCARGGYVAVDVKHHRSIDAGDAGRCLLAERQSRAWPMLSHSPSPPQSR